ncbi:uncharacterized protein EV422DRAFT_123730 [Fimicolochytrium jonesii]|uniref:uncharacterized protein n=1 Tax=Fimicolochytrium jonesii TaxID=1396493 RepID=UPI0022FDE79B|nr:uncharacterized protein EV422DRAFT_123730 [Fimicolochytrium jonesii]KAI8818877.1 hypothetical protein EV422DRAFT_123730 [Fimicolochytrium jonesii]
MASSDNAPCLANPACLACVLDPNCKGFFVAQGKIGALGAVSTAVSTFGPAALVAGCVIPIVFFGILLALHRLFFTRYTSQHQLGPDGGRVDKKRTWALLAGFLFLVLCIGALIKSLATFEGRTKGALIIGYVGYVGALMALNIAGALRFRRNLAHPTHRRILLIATVLVTLAIGLAAMICNSMDTQDYEGDLINYELSDRAAYLPLGLPIWYFLIAVYGLSREVRTPHARNAGWSDKYRPRTTAATSPHTQSSNNVAALSTGHTPHTSHPLTILLLTLLNLALIIAYLASAHSIRHDRRFETPGAILFATLFLANEAWIRVRDFRENGALVTGNSMDSIGTVPAGGATAAMKETV